MIKLTKIRLINWHYISNETVIVKDNVILTGPNASGKSTVLDALTFVLTAGDVKFNIAANEKGKRDLKGYVKCKLGIEDREYLREGDVPGHICLEFYNETSKTSFCVGAAIDAFGDLLPPKTQFYYSNDVIKDEMFISPDNDIYKSVEFRKNNPFFTYYATKTEAKRNFRNIFGSVNEDFFKLIQKALAFKPINDVKEFIYQNILEEKEIDISAIKDSIRSYKELETTLNVIKSKITDLKEIEAINEDIKSFEDNKNYYTYLMKLFDKEILKEKITANKKSITMLDESTIIKNQELLNIDSEIDSFNERSKELYAVLLNDEDFKAEEYINKNIERTSKEIESVKDSLDKYRKNVSVFKDYVNLLRKSDSTNNLYKEMYNIPLNNITNFDIERIKLNMIDFENRLSLLQIEIGKELGKHEVSKRDIVTDIREIRDTLDSLNNDKLAYNSQLLGIKKEIEQGLRHYYNLDISVHIFAELVDILDKNWADTIEIFLGNRRFNLIVEPKYFDYALNIFSRIKNKYKLYGIGLINTKQISKFNRCEANSLASIMTSQNQDAQAYINMTCGNVIMCDNETQLEKYSTSITNDGLIYSSYTVRAMNPNIAKPFIGSNAADDQKKHWNDLAVIKQKEFMEVNDFIKKYNEELSLIDQLDFKSINNNLENAILHDKLSSQLTILNKQKENINKLSINEIEDEYAKVLNTIKNLDNKKVSINQEIGGINSSVNQLLETINIDELSLLDMSEELANLSQKNILLEEKALEEYNSYLKSGKTTSQIAKFKDELSNLESDYDNRCDSLVRLQFKYINAYNSNLSTGISEIKYYLAELNKLEKSELITYEQKVRAAREEAEIIFKEDFISKLRNNIMTAESEITKINETLSTIKFGNDSYEFIFPKSKEFSIFYDMVITDDLNDGDSLLTFDFQKKYEQQLDELFASLAIDETNSKGALNKFTDYRTYMDYDIKISDASNQTMLYSKVFKEKSGGETQVPFYVAIIASFVRVYQHGKTSNRDTIGLVLFDEVFDRMDANRMAAMMEFITSMPIQIILACPPQRSLTLHNHVDTLLLMIRKDTKAQILDINTKEKMGEIYGLV